MSVHVIVAVVSLLAQTTRAERAYEPVKTAREAYATCVWASVDRRAIGTAAASEISDAALSECGHLFNVYRDAYADVTASMVSPANTPSARREADDHARNIREDLRRAAVSRVLSIRERVPPASAPLDRLDGIFWVTTLRDDRAGKRLYATGLLDGATYLAPPMLLDDPAAEVVKAHAQVLIKYVSGMSAEELGDGLDSFYNDERNRRIPISFAAAFVLYEAAGMSKSVLDARVERARRHYAPQ